jgi:oxygen-independent coproporphyrinogen-3 oxidase
MALTQSELIAKYDAPVPRYTSYPTVPYWTEAPSREQWVSHLRETLARPNATFSLYVHIPFCETLCTFCGCNTAITRDHKKEAPYVDVLLQELDVYLAQVPELANQACLQLHLGGGTPTFLAASELHRLISGLRTRLKMQRSDFEGSVEVDPRRTTREQLEALYKLGFHRVSLGVQDFDAEVQRLVNRIQPLDVTRSITEASREIGYRSVNFDLIYGLAKQTLVSFEETVRQTIRLKPDRIALYSFALVPWIKPAQRLFKDEDLPKPVEKRKLYERAFEMLIEHGYVSIGMDHFALPEESLAISKKEGRLHRNFMGYTDRRTDVLLALGVSGISETPLSFHQNEKVLPLYEEKVKSGVLATHRGHILTTSDQRRREQILEIMTVAQVKLTPEQIPDAKSFLKEMLDDGLAEVSGDTLRVLPKGHPFLRNVCLFFDERYRAQKPEAKTFSQAI